MKQARAGQALDPHMYLNYQTKRGARPRTPPKTKNWPATAPATRSGRASRPRPSGRQKKKKKWSGGGGRKAGKPTPPRRGGADSRRRTARATAPPPARGERSNPRRARGGGRERGGAAGAAPHPNRRASIPSGVRAWAAGAHAARPCQRPWSLAAAAAPSASTSHGRCGSRPQAAAAGTPAPDHRGGGGGARARRPPRGAAPPAKTENGHPRAQAAARGRPISPPQP